MFYLVMMLRACAGVDDMVVVDVGVEVDGGPEFLRCW